MNSKKNLDNILEPISLLFISYDFPPAGGGIITKNDIIQKFFNEDIEKLQQIFNLNLEQSIYLKEKLQKASFLMEKFPEFLSEFVLSKEFENEWNKMSQNERENILYFHEDSYFILRKIKEPHELIKIDFVSIINESDISISNWENFVETFNIPSEFKELPQNKVQLFKQKKTLQDLGYDVNKLNNMSFGTIMYLKELIKLFAENKSTNELLKIINTLNLDIPWHTKHDINFLESKEYKLTSGTKFKI